MFRRLNKRAQSTAEFAILIALVVAGLVAMQVYVKRGLQERVRQGVDSVDLGGQLADSNVNNIFTGGQYEPYYLQSQAQSTQSATETERLATGGGSTSATDTQSAGTRTQASGWFNQ